MIPVSDVLKHAKKKNHPQISMYPSLKNAKALCWVMAILWDGKECHYLKW